MKRAFSIISLGLSLSFAGPGASVLDQGLWNVYYNMSETTIKGFADNSGDVIESTNLTHLLEMGVGVQYGLFYHWEVYGYAPWIQSYNDLDDNYKYNNFGNGLLGAKYQVLDPLDGHPVSLTGYLDLIQPIYDYHDEVPFRSISSPGDGETEWKLGSSMGKGIHHSDLYHYFEFTAEYHLRMGHISEDALDYLFGGVSDGVNMYLAYTFIPVEYGYARASVNYMDQFDDGNTIGEDQFNAGLDIALLLFNRAYLNFYFAHTLYARNNAIQRFVGVNFGVSL